MVRILYRLAEVFLGGKSEYLNQTCSTKRSSNWTHPTNEVPLARFEPPLKVLTSAPRSRMAAKSAAGVD
jgi:hypothetical protein